MAADAAHRGRVGPKGFVMTCVCRVSCCLGLVWFVGMWCFFALFLVILDCFVGGYLKE